MGLAAARRFVAATVALVALGQPIRAGAQVVPGDPASSPLGEAPGATGAIDVRGSGGIQGVIPVGPGPSYPRVPEGITQPPVPFGPPSGLGLQVPSPVAEAVPESPLAGVLGAVTVEEVEGPPGGLTLDQAIDRLLRLNPDLHALSMELPKARADVLTAGLRGNPLIYADSSQIPYGNFRGSAGGPNQYDLNVTLPFDFNGKRRRRVEAAARALEVTEALYQDAVRLRIDTLYTAWVDVLAAKAGIEFLEDGLESLARQRLITERMVREGTADPTELNNVEIRIDSTDLALLEALETFDDAKRTLAALLEIPREQAETFPVAGTLRGLDLPAPPLEPLLIEARTTRPDLAAFRLGVLRARSEVELARANRHQDAFLVYQPFTAQQALMPGERTSYSWAAGLTVALPLFNRNQGNIARARHSVVQTQEQLKSLERQVDLEVRRAHAAYEVTLATITRLRTETLPAARENLERSLQRAGAGEAATLPAIEAQRAFGEVARQYLDALVRHRRAMLRLNTAMGARVFP